jgi:hypothetical protein
MWFGVLERQTADGVDGFEAAFPGGDDDAFAGDLD